MKGNQSSPPPAVADPGLVAPMESRLKGHCLYATVAALAACQTPPASNQGTLANKPAARIGGSASPSSQYEVDFGPLQPASFSNLRGGSIKPPLQAHGSRQR